MSTGLKAGATFTAEGLSLFVRAAFIECGWNYLSTCGETGRADPVARKEFAKVLRRDIKEQGFVIAKGHDFDATVSLVLDKIAREYKLPEEPRE